MGDNNRLDSDVLPLNHRISASNRDGEEEKEKISHYEKMYDEAWSMRQNRRREEEIIPATRILL